MKHIKLYEEFINEVLIPKAKRVEPWPFSLKELVKRIVEPAIGTDYEMIVRSKDINKYHEAEKMYKSGRIDAVENGWDHLYSSKSGHSYAFLSPDQKIIGAAAKGRDGSIDYYIFIKK